MRKNLVLAFILVIALNIMAYIILPDRVAVHFGKGGEPDSWGNKETFLAVIFGIELLFFGLIWFGPAIILRLPPEWISMPNRSYWLSEERLSETRQKLESIFFELGIVLFLFFLFITAATIHAHQSAPVRLNETYFWIGFVLFFVYVIYWSAKLFARFRIPKEKPNPDLTR